MLLSGRKRRNLPNKALRRADTPPAGELLQGVLAGVHARTTTLTQPRINLQHLPVKQNHDHRANTYCTPSRHNLVIVTVIEIENSTTGRHPTLLHMP